MDNEVIILLLDLSIVQQCQIKQVVHLELDEAGGGLNLLQDVQLFLWRDV